MREEVKTSMWLVQNLKELENEGGEGITQSSHSKGDELFIMTKCLK